MADMGRFMQLVIVGLVFAYDHSQGAGVAGFCIGSFYFLAAMYSLVTKDTRMFKKRMIVVALFVVEIFAVAGMKDNPVNTGFLDEWTRKLAK